MGYKYFLGFFIIAFLVGCQSSEKTQSTSISGEIVNPQSSSIRILKNNVLLDTVPIKKDNRFYYRFSDTVTSGLYTFQHDYDTYYETQTFYIEKGDSLQFRLNTRDFDESLMYSGSNAEANNFLMKLFLENQNNSRIVPNYYRIGPKEYVQKVDSIKESQKRQLHKLFESHKISKEFKEFAGAVINYATFDLHERYYFLVNKYNKKFKKELPDNFLAYREKADFNDKALQSHYIYQYFLDDYLKNIAVEECLAEKAEWHCFDLRSEESLARRFHISDSLFKLRTLRSSFLTTFGARLIVDADSEAKIDSIVHFLEHTKDYGSVELERIYGLATVHKRQFIGNIGDLTLSGTNGKEVKIAQLLNKPTVFYYWSSYYKNHREILYQRITELRSRYPQLNFIGINIDDQDLESWKASISPEDYRKMTEVQLVCPPSHRSFYRNYLNKLVFADEKGTVLNNDLNIRDRQLEEKLIGLLQ